MGTIPYKFALAHKHGEDRIQSLFASLAWPQLYVLRCERVLEDHARPVLSLAVAGSKLFSGSYDYTIKVWCLDTLTRLKNLTGESPSPCTSGQVPVQLGWLGCSDAQQSQGSSGASSMHSLAWRAQAWGAVEGWARQAV